MKTRVLLLLIILLQASGPLYSQGRQGGFGYFMGGVNFMSSGKIAQRMQNPTLMGNGFNFTNPGLLFGGRGMGVFGRFIIGGAGFGGSQKGASDSGDVSLGSGGGFFDVGYLFTKKDKSMFYGFAGFGGGGNTLEVNNTSKGTMQFTSNQQIPSGENRKLSTGGFGFELGVGFNRRIVGGNDEYGSGGFMVGLTAGAYFFPSTTWKFEANKSTVAGLGNISGFYIALTIGGGGWSK